MALQVWLPLNGNLKNQGLSEVSISQWNISYSSGKITNNSATFSRNSNDTKVGININGLPLHDQETWSCWFKYSGTATATQDDSHTIMTIGTDWEGIRLNTSGLFVHNVHSTKKGISLTGIQINTWYHIVAIIDRLNNLMSLYKDGNLVGTSDLSDVDYSTFNTSIRGIGTLGSSTVWYILGGSINDVRIYDHCLSQKEIKELSKGLCLHYKLSRGGENLLTNSIGEFSGNNTSTSSYKDFKAWSDIVTPESDSWYTTSFDLKGNINGSYFYQYLFNNSTGRQCDKSILYINGKLIGNYTATDGNTGLIPVTTDWKHIEIARHFNTNTTALAKTLLFRIRTGTNYTVYIRNVKLEKGGHATPWIPNKSDTLYSQLGYNNIEPDCSGYGNDGTISGTLTYSNDTPRYEGSSYLTDSESCIKIGDLSKISPSGIFTFNIWFKKLTGIWSSKTWETILGGPSGFEIESKLGSTTNNYIHPYNWGGGSVSTPNSYSIPYNLDTWNMLTMVRTASDTKFYLNGELKVTGTAGTIPSGDYFLGAWRDSVSQNYRGILSDARIYATALSAEDVKALYNTPISIDNHKNLHCMELEQTNNQTSFCKSGVAKMELLPIPEYTYKCTASKTIKTWTNGSQLKLNDVHKIRVIFRSRGDGTPTSSKCSSIHAAVFENSWKWSVNPIYWSSATAYSNIGKIIDYTGSFIVNSTVTSTTTNISITLYWLIEAYYGNGSDNQTHDLYYYKYWNATTGKVYAEGGTPEYDRITTNELIEI